MTARDMSSLLQVGKECGSCDGQVCRHAPGCLLDEVVGGSPGEFAWVDPECGCDRSPDVPEGTPCPIHKPKDSSLIPVISYPDVPKGKILLGVPLGIEVAHGEIIKTARHILRYGKLGKQSERRLREALKRLDEAVDAK